jgi:hypothetical protein
LAGRSASWAIAGLFFDVTTMMTDKSTPKSVLHKPGCAIWTLKPMPTFPAKCEGCIAAAIEKKQHLFAALQGFVCGRRERF